MDKVKCDADINSLESSHIERIIGKAVKAGVIALPDGDSWRDLVADCFHMLYDTEPRVAEKPHEERIVNNAVMRLMLPQAETTRVRTAGSLLGALAATTTVYEIARSDKTIQEAMKKQEEQNKERQKSAQQNSEENGGGENGNDEQKSDSGAANGGDKESNNPEPSPLQQMIEKLGENVVKRAEIKRAMSKAGEIADAAKSLVRTFSASQGKEAGIDMPPEDVQKIADIVNQHGSNLLRIAELIGRYRDMATRSLQAVRNSYVGQNTAVGPTRDILRMFPTDRMYLMHPGMPPLIRTQKIGRFVQSGLLGWRPLSEGKGAGSTVMAVDDSGSMSCVSIKNDTLAVHAKCIALGIALAIRADASNSRDYRAFSFSYHKSSLRHINSKDSMDEHMSWAARHSGGGTNFDMAIRVGISKLKEMEKAGVVGGDLSIITDGAGVVGDDVVKEWREYSSKTGSRMVVIDLSNGYEAKHYPHLTNLADKYVLVTSIDNDTTSEIVFNIVSEMELGRIQRSLAKEQ